MKKRTPTEDHTLVLLDAHGLDLLAQAEAIVRAVREYQTAVQQMRVRRTRATAAPAPGVHASAGRIRASCSNLSGTLDEIDELIGPAAC